MSVNELFFGLKWFSIVCDGFLEFCNSFLELFSVVIFSS